MQNTGHVTKMKKNRLLSLQLNSCLQYAKNRACHRNLKKNCLHVNKN